MKRYLSVLGTLMVGLALSRPGTGQPSRAVAKNSVTAIDILLEPDATMVERAKAANQRLLTMYPKGFRLGNEHQPHISCLQRYVRTADLGKVYEAVGKVLAGEKPTSWMLKAYKYDFAVWDKLAITVIVVEPTADLIRYQQRLIEAVAPFTVKTGTAAAFVTTPKDPDINRPTIDYVATYVPAASGTKFIPHVTVGVALPEDVKKMVSEKFDTFTFSPVGRLFISLATSGRPGKSLRAGNSIP